MKKSIFAALVWAACMAPMSATATEYNNDAPAVEAENEVYDPALVAEIQEILGKSEIRWNSDGACLRPKGVISRAAARSWYYDVSDRVEIKLPAERNGKVDSLVVVMDGQAIRNAINGWSIGGVLGVIKMAENISATLGIAAEYVGRLVQVGASIEAAISKYNKESNRAGDAFVAPIFTAKVGFVLCRLPLRGLNNKLFISAGYQFKYILDKTESLTSQNVYYTDDQKLTETSYFMVEGNSMCHCGYIDMRFAPKHMGRTSFGIELFAGAFNRYYPDGYHREFMCGANVRVFFSGAKKHVDPQVARFRNSLETGNMRAINEMANQLRRIAER